MMKISIPDINQAELLNACIDNMDASDRKTRLITCKQDIISCSQKYRENAEKSSLSKETIPETNSVGNIRKDDMVFLYDGRLVKSKKGRFFYDKIKANAPYGICPFCGHYEVDTLDHYLPKAVFFQYAITKENLVPACIKCNKNKTSEVPEDRTHETIHPYYDDFDDEVWLVAEIDDSAGEPFGFSFYAIKPDSWSEEKYQRAKNHLIVFKLKRLFRVLSAADISKELKALAKLYTRTHNYDVVRNHVLDLCDVEREENKNSWKAASYQCLYDSEWMWDVFFPKYVGNYINGGDL